jgi:hypothetical protein
MPSVRRYICAVLSDLALEHRLRGIPRPGLSSPVEQPRGELVKGR